MLFRRMRIGGLLHAFLVMELYKRMLSTRCVTHSFRVRIYKTLVRPMEKGLIMCKKENPAKNVGPDYGGQMQNKTHNKLSLRIY
jgi:hypothetical protein